MTAWCRKWQRINTLGAIANLYNNVRNPHQEVVHVNLAAPPMPATLLFLAAPARRKFAPYRISCDYFSWADLCSSAELTSQRPRLHDFYELSDKLGVVLLYIIPCAHEGESQQVSPVD